METTHYVFHSWVKAFEMKNADEVARWYHENAVNWQVADEPVVGRAAIREMMHGFFTAFPDSYTNIESVLFDLNGHRGNGLAEVRLSMI